MPIVAVAGAVIAGFVAAPAIAGIAAGGLAALTVTGALEITAAVGATLGAVGVVTRDKGLQTAGLVLGGIGGIGSLASAAGLIDGATSLFGDAGTSASDIASAVDVTASPAGFGGEAAGGLSATEAAVAGIPSSANVTPSPAGFNGGIVDSLGGVNEQAALPTSPIEQSVGKAAGQASDIVPNPVTGTTGDTTQTAGGGLINSAATNTNVTPPVPGEIPDAVQVTNSPAGFADRGALGSALKGISDFATSSPLASYGLIQAGGSLVNGLFNPMTTPQIDQLNSQSALNRAAAAIQQRQAANAAQPLPVAKRVQTAPVTGLINTRGQTVTGAPL